MRHRFMGETLPLTGLQLINRKLFSFNTASKIAKRRQNALKAGYNLYDMYRVWNTRKKKGVKLP